jgi:hypothetical protein
MTMKRVMAVSGAVLMVAGVGFASPAQAQDRDRDRDRGGCTVELDTRARGNILDIEVDGPRRADDAVVRVDFDRGRTVTRRIDLDRRGRGELSVRVPNRADDVEVDVFIRDGRRVVRCDADLNL